VALEALSFPRRLLCARLAWVAALGRRFHRRGAETQRFLGLGSVDEEQSVGVAAFLFTAEAQRRRGFLGLGSVDGGASVGVAREALG
jgi:hypothetical protein